MRQSVRRKRFFLRPPGRRSSCGTPVVVPPAAPRSSFLLRAPLEAARPFEGLAGAGVGRVRIADRIGRRPTPVERTLGCVVHCRGQIDR